MVVVYAHYNLHCVHVHVGVLEPSYHIVKPEMIHGCGIGFPFSSPTLPCACMYSKTHLCHKHFPLMQHHLISRCLLGKGIGSKKVSGVCLPSVMVGIHY